MNSKIRVAFWHNTFAPYRVPLFQQLAAYPDIDLTVYYGSPKDRHRQWAVNFGAGYAYKLLPHVTIPGYPHKFNHTFFQELLRQRYDVLIASENELGCQIAFWASRRLKRPFIVWSEEINYQIVRDVREYTLASVLRKTAAFIGRKLHYAVFFPFYYGAVYVKRHADACIAAGQKTEEHLRSLGATCPCFHHGSTIDTLDFTRQLQAQQPDALKQALGIAGKTVVLSVSYLQKRKGVQYLIEAFLAIQPPNAVLLIVGDGEYKSELRKLVPPDCRNILFLGHDESPAKYYALADIFVMPSFSDPWGLTVNEAMLAGLPVITTTNVGAQELIQGNGYVIPPRDAAALKAALETLLRNPILRETMGKRSREIIKAYTIEHSAAACYAAIQAVMRGRSPNAHEFENPRGVLA